MTLRYTDMDPKDALYKIARRYPGGIAALAHRMGLSEAVLYNKLRPSISTHHVSQDEFSEIVEFCQSAGVEDALLPLHALNWRHRRVDIAVPVGTDRSDSELEASVCNVIKEIGDIASTQTMSLADKKISPEEFDRIKREFSEAHAALGEWYSRLEDRFKAQQGKASS